MFEDLGEQEYVFGLLDEWAQYPNEYSLTDLIGNKSVFNSELTKLMDAVQKLETKTIKKNPKLTLGFSLQSELLGKLLSLLMNSNTPAKLLASLPEIKEALLQSMVICNEVEKNKLKNLADIGDRRSKQVKDWSRKGRVARKKYSDRDHQNWAKEANKLVAKNHKLSLRDIATKISHSDTKKPPFETIRKFLSKNWVKPSNLPT